MELLRTRMELKGIEWNGLLWKDIEWNGIDFEWKWTNVTLKWNGLKWRIERND